jgi:hypothetical protein
MVKKAISIISGIAVLVAALSFIAPAQPALTINFSHYVGDKLLRLDSTTYTNALGQQYTVSKLKYYIGNICLKKSDGKEFKSGQYFLVNEEDSASKHIALADVPEGEYTSLSFTVGVDSLHNCNGAQDGALDPVNAMYWTWNTGYIFFKMEGKSPVSTSPGHLLEFHIGGYKQPYNCLREVHISLPKGFKIGSNGTINLKTDLAKFFSPPTDFSKVSSITDFHGAMPMADNYARMFSVKQ